MTRGVTRAAENGEPSGGAPGGFPPAPGSLSAPSLPPFPLKGCAPVTHTDTVAEAWTQVDRVAHDLLRPISTEAQHAQALEVIEALMIRIEGRDEHPLTTLLELLVERVHAYEEIHHAIPAAPPSRLLAFLMDQNNLTQSAVAQATGINQSNLSKLLRGEREFNTQHIKALSEFFHVSPAVFIA